MQIMTNPHRGRGGKSPLVSYGATASGHRPTSQTEEVTNSHVNTLRQTINDGLPNVPSNPRINERSVETLPPAASGRGGFGQPHPRGGSAFSPNLARGGGYIRGSSRGGNQFVGRGGAFSRGFRGRGRGGQAPAVQT